MTTCLHRLSHKPVGWYAFLFVAILLSVHLPSRAQNNKLIIRSGTQFIVAGNTLVLNSTDIEAAGNLSAPNGTVVLTGNASAVNGSTAPVISVLALSKSGNSVVTLNNDVTVNSLLTFTSGIIDLNGSTLTLAEGGTLQDESETSRITGLTGGAVTTVATSVNNPSQQNPGNLGAAITSGQNLAGLTISRMHQPAVVADTETGIQRTYLIQPDNNTALDATLRFYYFDAELNGNDENTLSLWTSTDGVSWSKSGVSGRSTGGNYVEQSGLPSLAYVTLSDAGGVLPVTLVSFRATCNGTAAQIQWKTASEANTRAFVVQRSSNAAAWTDVQTVAAANSPLGSSYTCTDGSPQTSAYYRLKMVDNNGSATYSPVFSGGCSDVAMPFRVYPNPARDRAVATLSVREAAKATVVVYSAGGKPVYNSSWSLQPGINQLVLPVSNLAAGTYLVTVAAKGITSQTKLVKQ